jgi:DNA-binding response OmpR family regulator
VKVLIIDDYLDYAFTLKDRFEFEGHEAMYCLTSTNAVNMALEFKPDWLILDVRMAYNSGVSVYRELKKKADFEFSVVFYSNYCNDKDVKKEFEDLRIPIAAIISKTTDMNGDVVDKIIPALQAGYIRGGKKDGQ